jgi:hypothetical protein
VTSHSRGASAGGSAEGCFFNSSNARVFIMTTLGA